MPILGGAEDFGGNIERLAGLTLEFVRNPNIQCFLWSRLAPRP
jgi:hypothetical protein